MFVRLLMVALVAISLVGCASLQRGDQGTKTVIQFATLKFIDEDTERARGVYAHVQEARGFLTEEGSVSLDQLEVKVRDSIPWARFDQAEQLLLSNLIDMVRVELEDRIEGGLLDPDEQVAVENVLKWIEQAAQMAGGSSDVAVTETLLGHAAVGLG